MAAGTSLGEGLGLQSGQRNDYWMRQLAVDDQRRQAQAKKEEDELAKMAEIDIDYGKYLYKYGQAIGQEHRAMINDIAKMRQEDPRVSRGALKERVLRAKQTIGAYEIANAQAKSYIEKQGIKKDEALVSDLQAMSGTVADLGKHADGRFVQIGPKGEFSYYGVPDKNIPVAFDKNTDYTEEFATTTRRIGDKDEYIKQHKISESAIQREINKRASNQEFILQVLYNNRNELKGLPLTDKRVIETINKAAEVDVRGQIPSGYEERVLYDPYRPPQGSSSSSKIIKPIVTRDSKATIKIVEGDPLYDKKTADEIKGIDAEIDKIAATKGDKYNYTDKTGKTTTMSKAAARKKLEDEKESLSGKFVGTTVYPYTAAIPEAKPVTISYNNKVLDAGTNKSVGKQIGQIYFKPDNVVVQKNVGGGYSRYFMGTGYEMSEVGADGKPATSAKTYSLKVPYDETAVRSAVESKYDLSELNQGFDELQSGGGSKSGGTSNNTALTGGNVR